MYGRLIIYNIDSSVLVEADIQQVPCILGRVEPSDWVVPHSSISRQHASIELENGTLTIKDKQSTNGLIYESKKVDHIVLDKSLTFKMGDLKVEFKPTIQNERTVISSLADADKTTVSLPSKVPTANREPEILNDDIFSAKTFVQIKPKVKPHTPQSVKSESSIKKDPHDIIYESDDHAQSAIESQRLWIYSGLSVLVMALLVFLRNGDFAESLSQTILLAILSSSITYIHSYFSNLNLLRVRTFFIYLNLVISLYILNYLLFLDAYNFYIDSLLVTGGIGYFLSLLIYQINDEYLQFEVSQKTLTWSLVFVSLIASILIQISKKEPHNLTALVSPMEHLWAPPSETTHPLDQIITDLSEHWSN